MNVSHSILLASILAAALALGQAVPTSAAPLGAAAIRHDAASNSGPRIELAGGGFHFAGGHGYFHGGHFGRFGPGVFLGLPYYGYGPAYYYDDDDYYDDDGGPADLDDPVALCQARYRSFDPESGTFLGYDGFRHPCPYLG